VLVQLWPSGGEVPRTGFSGSVLGTSWKLTADQHLLVLVIFAGTLGGFSRSLIVLGTYIGKRDLKWQYLLSYLVWPTVGAVFALVLYVVIRAGFVGLNGTAEKTNAYGFLAIAILAGLFANMAQTKMKQVAKAFFEESLPESEREKGQGG
jgi:hypothetical protein